MLKPTSTSPGGQASGDSFLCSQTVIPPAIPIPSQLSRRMRRGARRHSAEIRCGARFRTATQLCRKAGAMSPRVEFVRSSALARLRVASSGMEAAFGAGTQCAESITTWLN